MTALYAAAVAGGVLVAVMLTALVVHVMVDLHADVARFAAARWTR